MSAELTAQDPSANYLVQLQPPLVRHFDLIARAPDGVARLRELILTLAVQGKLVPQDPRDEPAGELLKKIRAEKDRLIAEGKIKREKPPAEVSGEELSYQVPAGWSVVRLSDLVRVLNGRAYSKQELLEAGPIPVLRVGNLFTSNHWYFSDLELETDKLCVEGDLLYAWSASFGPFIWKGPKAIFHYHIWKLDPFAHQHIDVQFLHTFLQEKTAEIKAAGHGVSMVHMTKEKMEKIVVPLPPLAEQSRIVSRVNELMQFYDALEASGQLEAHQHAQLVNVLLSTLTQSETPEVLVNNWHRIVTHFDLLLDRPEAVDAFEQTILQLAVRGLLVPQDPSDEPTSALLQKIRVEKDRLINEGKIKRDKPLPPIAEDERPFALPPGWVWVRLGEISDFTNGFAFPSNEFSSDAAGIGIVKIGDLQNGLVTTASMSYVSQQYAESIDDSFRVDPGDMLIAMSGATTGKLGFNRHETSFLLNQRVGKIVFRLVNQEFAYHYLTTKIAENLSISAGSAIPNLSTAQIKEIVFPLAPLAEQSRIVARVDELRALCAALRAKLAAQQSTASNLAEALIEGA